MGDPAATLPTKGMLSCSMMPWAVLGSRRMLREAPGTMEMAPFLASALRCVSAALGDLNPRAEQMSSRVGGKPVSSICLAMKRRISCWRSVRSCMYTLSVLFFYTVLLPGLFRNFFLFFLNRLLLLCLQFPAPLLTYRRSLRMGSLSFLSVYLYRLSRLLWVFPALRLYGLRFIELLGCPSFLSSWQMPSACWLLSCLSCLCSFI